jgi:hypothetical protein
VLIVHVSTAELAEEEIEAPFGAFKRMKQEVIYL